jgi:hypothetical protein
VTRLLLIIFSALLANVGGSSGCLGFECIGSATPVVLMSDGEIQRGYKYPETGKGPLRVEIERQGDAFRIYRGGEPYYIKGIGGRDFLESAAAAGANSIRTWAPGDADVLLDRAQSLNMTVMLGVWLSQHASDYADPIYKKRKIQEVQSLVDRHKSHPALLIWSLGNEINLEGADSRAAWRFVDDLVQIIKVRDPNHPVITVIACNQTTLNNIAAFAPNLDAVGINAYGSVSSLRTMVDKSLYDGPYIIAEWGVDGHWEAMQTSWGRPLEPTGTQKAEFHLLRYTHDILANSDRCIGSYVFLWGQKQERTPTWYSMFLDNLPGTNTAIVSSPAVDAMHFNWTGRWPVNRAPLVLTMRINGVSANSNIILSPGEPIISLVEAADPENDNLSYVWELLEEPKVLGTGGSHEPRPKTLASVRRDNLPVLSLRAPLTAGEYRLFVYVLDHNGHAGTANIPFQVREFRKQANRPAQNPLRPG